MLWIEEVVVEHIEHVCSLYFTATLPNIIPFEAGGDQLVESMEKVFTTDLSKLQLIDNTRVFNIPDFLKWSSVPVPYIYWRDCYTYLLCSLIAGLEKKYESQLEDDGVAGALFIVTGTQGTGKTVLGVLVSLFLHQCFDWTVIYFGNGKNFTLQGNVLGKQVDIFDLSDQEMPTSKSFHTIIFSSCNETRWHDKAQQATATEKSGNFVFVDLFSKAETVQAARQLAACRNATVDIDNVNKCFDKAGGIARFCLGRNGPSNIERVVKAANRYLSRGTDVLAETVQKLVDLNDSAEGDDSKMYPGLILHCIPQTRFKNHFSLKFGSSEIRRNLFAALRTTKNGAIESLLSDLMKRSESRGLAGVVYEEWMNKLSTDKWNGGCLYFQGTELPAKENSEISSHQFPTDKLHTICFNDFEDLKKILDGLDLEKVMPIYGFTRTRNHEAIDGVLLFKDCQGNRVLAGVQYTTAAKRHPVSEKGILCLEESATRNGATAEIWFTQPQQCLEATASIIVELQPLKFAKPKPLGRSGETQKRTTVKQSNKRKYWETKSRNVKQLVMVTCFKETVSTNSVAPTDLQKILAERLENLGNGGDEESFITESEPELRPWDETVRVARQLHGDRKADFLKEFLADFIDEAATHIEDVSDQSEAELNDY